MPGSDVMRLFVAVDLPQPIKDQLGRLQTGVAAARWVGHDHMHLTLFFIGETEKSVDTVRAALAGAQAKAFALALAGVGRFPPGDRRPPRVLWVGVSPQPALADLHARVTAALVGIGFAADDRPFHPHITLARLKTGQASPPGVQRWLQQHAAFQTAPFAVGYFSLFSSTLTPQGAHYRVLGRYPLA
jgi:2'-5' RNA ligase